MMLRLGKWQENLHQQLVSEWMELFENQGDDRWVVEQAINEDIHLCQALYPSFMTALEILEREDLMEMVPCND